MPGRAPKSPALPDILEVAGGQWPGHQLVHSPPLRPSPAQGSLCRQALPASQLQLREPAGPALDTLQAPAMTPRFWSLCRDGPVSHS